MNYFLSLIEICFYLQIFDIEYLMSLICSSFGNVKKDGSLLAVIMYIIANKISSVECDCETDFLG